MATNDEAAQGHPTRGDRQDAGERVVRVSLELRGEHAAALEGWRLANGIADPADAVRELVRLGLLSEIGRIYRFVADGRADASDVEDSLSDMHGIVLGKRPREKAAD